MLDLTNSAYNILGVVDERDPRYLGTASLSANDFVHAAIAKSDLIVNVGHDVIV